MCRDDPYDKGESGLARSMECRTRITQSTEGASAGQVSTVNTTSNGRWSATTAHSRAVRLSSGYWIHLIAPDRDVDPLS